VVTSRLPPSTLGDVRVQDGSLLSLHSIGSSAGPDAPSAAGGASGAKADAAGECSLLSPEALFATCATAVPPRDTIRGHHSFAGIIFDVEAVSEREVWLTSVHMAGMCVPFPGGGT
jgi:hypothetical protein